MNDYEKKYGIRFFITTGNHDPVGPLRKEGGKNDFLDSEGNAYSILSSAPLNQTKTSKIVVTKDIAESGYIELLHKMENFGFTPRKQDLFWQTLFSTNTFKEYNFSTAQKDAQIENRVYEVIPGYKIPDLSYVVEVSPKIWLLAIDGNTYLPKNREISPANPENYAGAGRGYNNVITNKTHLISWVKKD